MHELMLKPGWPGTFHRTVKTDKGERLLTFSPNLPVQVTADEMKLLAPDIGLAIWPIERDDKKRPRFVESVPTPAKAAEKKPEAKHAAHTTAHHDKKS